MYAQVRPLEAVLQLDVTSRNGPLVVGASPFVAVAAGSAHKPAAYAQASTNSPRPESIGGVSLRFGRMRRKILLAS